jgi:hypothetical protein
MEKRKQKLSLKLKELQNKPLQIESIKKEIKEAETDQRGLRIRIFLLSWLGAVILPSIFFIGSLICSVLGLNSGILAQDLETQGFLEQQFTIFSVGTLAIGFMVLLFVIRTIDSAAKQIPLPEFEVYFEEHGKSMKLKRKEQTTIVVTIENKGEDMAEDMEVYVFFSPSFRILPIEKEYRIVRQSNTDDFPNYSATVTDINRLYMEVRYPIGIALTAPDDKKNYEIPIDICERKTGMTKDKLTIEVTD